MSKIMRDINLQIQEAEQTPNKINSKKSLPRYIIIKMLQIEDKEKFSTVAERRNVTLPIGKHQFEQVSHLKS